MMTPHMQAALAELERLNEGIAHSQANIRVLENAGVPATLELKENLRKAVNSANAMKLAIEKEAMNPQ